MSEEQRNVPAAWEGTTNWYWRAVRNYAGFRGRAQRAEFWWFTLGDWAITLLLGFLGEHSQLLAFLGTIYFFALFVPRLAVKVRRLHDSNRSGWLVLWLYGPPLLFLVSFFLFFFLGGWMAFGGLLTPLTFFLWAFGAVWFLIVMCLPGTAGRNRYGPDPLGRAEPDEVWADIA